MLYLMSLQLSLVPRGIGIHVLLIQLLDQFSKIPCFGHDARVELRQGVLDLLVSGDSQMVIYTHSSPAN